MQILQDLSKAEISKDSEKVLTAITASPIINHLTDEMIKGCLFISISLSGVKQMPDDLTTFTIIKFLRSECGTMTMDEVNCAFELNAWGKLNDKHEAFGLFDVNYVAKVMNDYRFKRIEARKELERNKPKLQEAPPPTDEELYNGLMKFAEFPEYYNWSAVFKHLEKIGEIKMTLDEKKSQFAEVYTSMVNRMSLTDRANLDELEFKDMVAQECRKLVVRRWYELNKTT